MGAMAFGFSAQSDESRHMTLGLEIIKFILEQDPDNLPIVQAWIDKWFWRGYRVLTLVAMMMDYMLPKRVMSWKEAWETYAEQNGGALFNDLARYGIKVPAGWEQACKDKDHLSHQAWNVFYNYGAAAPFHTWAPSEKDMEWLSAKYPDTFDKYYRPVWEHYAKEQAEGRRFYNKTLPMLCQTCQIPMFFTEPGDPTLTCLPRDRLPGRELPLLLRRLQAHLRQRAREVRPELAARAPDLPGQLLPRGRRPDQARLRPAGRGAALVPHGVRSRQPRLRHFRGQEELRRVAWPGDEEHLTDAGCGCAHPQRSSVSKETRHGCCRYFEI